MWNLLAAFLLIGAHSLCTALPVNNAAVAAAHQHDTKGIAAGSGEASLLTFTKKRF